MEEIKQLQESIKKHLYDNRITWLELQSKKQVFGVSWKTLFTAAKGRKVSATSMARISEGLGIAYDIELYKKSRIFQTL